MLENRKMEDTLARNSSGQMQALTQLEQKKAENARLMANLNEAKAQIHFASKKEKTMVDETQDQIREL